MSRRQHVLATGWFSDALSLSDLLNDARERMAGWQHGWAIRHDRLPAERLLDWSHHQEVALDHSMSWCRRRLSVWRATYPNPPEVDVVWQYTATSAALHLQAAGLSLETEIWLRRLSTGGEHASDAGTAPVGHGLRAAATGRHVVIHVAVGAGRHRLRALCKQARSGLDSCNEQLESLHHRPTSAVEGPPTGARQAAEAPISASDALMPHGGCART